MTIAPWPPTRYSAPLSPEHESLFERYRAAFAVVWRVAFGYTLEAWQEALLHAVTELRPDGHLRYRQVIVSVGRQNGKTEIAAALALLWLLHRAHGLVIGIASTAEQARLVYDRAARLVGRNPALARRFSRLTDTRGLQTTAGGRYEVKAAKSAALQGLPVDLAVADEVHLLKPALWSDLVNGMGGRSDTLVVGITTAGDEDSVLLKDLYRLAETGEIGHFIWEAPEARVPEDDETLADYLRAANPAIASGRIDVEVVIADVRAMPAEAAVRFRLNRFLASSSSAYLDLAKWSPLAGPLGDPVLPVLAVDVTPDWSAASVVAAWRVEDKIHTEVASSLVRPDVDRLEAEIVRLCGVRRPLRIVGDGYRLRPLVERLKARGLPAAASTLGDATASASRLYARVATKTLVHAGDPLLALQIPKSLKKAVGEGFRITRQPGSEIDAVIATASAVFFAEIVQDTSDQLFV